jgi:hypothetical protein
MFRRFALLILCAELFSSRGIQAGHPTYLVLRPMTTGAPHHPTYERYPGEAKDVQARGYSYGWFGAQPTRRYWARHYGYYGSFREWSAK